ncbi:hypothetical protein [Kitasatospora sp. DSM 101779]|uniref:hypothetical protein n=1 Tax=Kitasatospora sp. DSM 101779 TaxID=2853165 RepID=UPI0021D80F21|nr:hypothetical protein [Kitasatospora sp. DSM 101779]MCU7825088.1 hypothetical protein [Kitasatospora sp. DSM 101779]
MGFINQAKGTTAGKESADAYIRGDSVFVRNAIEADKNSLPTGPMVGTAEQIRAIEAAGWTLANLAVGEGKTPGGERIALAMLFRRRA